MKKSSMFLLIAVAIASAFLFSRFEQFLVGFQLWIAFIALLLALWCFYWKHWNSGLLLFSICLVAAFIEFVPR